MLGLGTGRRSEGPARDHLAALFELGRKYGEMEVNALLKQCHTFGGWALLRRELFDTGRLGRSPDGARYWRAAARDADEEGGSG